MVEFNFYKDQNDAMKGKIMKKFAITLTLAASIMVSGCMTNQQWGMNKQTAGATTGAVLGGMLGSNVGSGKGQLWATGAGALLGAFVGSSIGASLDRADQQYHTQTVEQAYDAPIGNTISWSNPESGHSGSVTPVQEGTHANGNYCRKYKQTIVVDGQVETAYGTACKENGEWMIVNG